MLSRIAREAGLTPLHNRSGSNLMRGVAAMLVQAASIGGRIAGAAAKLAILEVDEATLPLVVPAVQPRVIVFTNLFRDQLDRYGEVDAVALAWDARSRRPRRDTTLVLNADDPAVAHLGEGAAGRVLYYGVDDTSAAGDARPARIGLPHVPALRRRAELRRHVLRTHRPLALRRLWQPAAAARRTDHAGRRRRRRHDADDRRAVRRGCV